MATNARTVAAAATQLTATTLVEQSLPLVDHLVRDLLTKVPPHVSRDELASAGRLALVTSAQAFDPARGVPFARFAAIRIRGALLDELRRMDWAARSVRPRVREVESARDELAAALGRAPRREELAAVLGTSTAELDGLRSDVARASVLSVDGFAPDAGADLVADPGAGPETLLLMREELGYLHHAIAELPARLRFVVTAYFFQQRQMSAIAADLGVTESRISQLRAEALRLIRDGMNAHLNPGLVEPPATARAAARDAAYAEAIGGRGTVRSRLALSTPGGQILPNVLTG